MNYEYTKPINRRYASDISKQAAPSEGAQLFVPLHIADPVMRTEVITLRDTAARAKVKHDPKNTYYYVTLLLRA